MNIRKKTKINSRIIDANIKIAKTYCNKYDYFTIAMNHKGEEISGDFIKSDYIKRMQMIRKILNRDIRQIYSNYGKTR